MRTIIRPGIGVGLGLILWFCLATPTPRARLNVTETVVALFFATLLKTWAKRSALPAFGDC
jgi:hypothetical protein